MQSTWSFLGDHRVRDAMLRRPSAPYGVIGITFRDNRIA